MRVLHLILNEQNELGQTLYGLTDDDLGYFWDGEMLRVWGRLQKDLTGRVSLTVWRENVNRVFVKDYEDLPDPEPKE